MPQVLRWLGKLVFPGTVLLLFVTSTANLFLLGQPERLHGKGLVGNSLTESELDQRTSMSYLQVLPTVADSDGWNIVDIGQRAKKKENARPQLLNLPLEPPTATKVNPSSKNRTQDYNVLIYNRVPKCASTTMQHIISKLQSKNGFKFKSANVYHRKVLRPDEFENLLGYLRNSKQKIVFDRHMFYVDWEKYGLNANYINVVREPIKRFVSHFYYLRSLGRWRDRKEKPPRAWFEKDLETCVFSGDPECKMEIGEGLQLTYFCGTVWECSNPKSRKALLKAMENIEEKYSVVGVLENLENSLHVMEKYIPAFFSGSVEILLNSSKTELNRNTYPEPSSKVIEKMRQDLGYELELYEFIKQRLAKQMRHLNIVT